MAIEIEYKFLVNRDKWKTIIPEKSTEIRQAYLSTEPAKNIRVRTKGKFGYITIKGLSDGPSRVEYEYEIPYSDALELISNFCNSIIEKTRHLVTYKGKTWEVDVFHGSNENLIIAEIELSSIDEPFEIPEWLDKDVTNDSRYTNSSLSINPYNTW